MDGTMQYDDKHEERTLCKKWCKETRRNPPHGREAQEKNLLYKKGWDDKEPSLQDFNSRPPFPKIFLHAWGGDQKSTIILVEMAASSAVSFHHIWRRVEKRWVFEFLFSIISLCQMPPKGQKTRLEEKGEFLNFFSIISLRSTTPCTP